MIESAPRLLLTVFEPFGGAEVNASKLVGEALAAADPSIELLVLPVTIGVAEEILLTRLATGERPSLIIALGEAGPEPVVRLEKVAINYDDFRIPDNGGNQPRARPIRPGGPDAWFATLPVEAVAARLKGATPIPVVVSLSAGAFLCNHISYCALDWLAANAAVPFGFVHVPCWREGNGLSLADIIETVRSAVFALRESGVGQSCSIDINVHGTAS